MTGFAKEKDSVCRLGFNSDFALGLGATRDEHVDMFAEWTK